jgi:alcohol dehydrogenase (NADP+)
MSGAPCPLCIPSFRVTKSSVGGLKSAPRFCGKHNITSDVEVIAIQKVNEAYNDCLNRMKYRFSIDMVPLKSE